LPVVPGKKFLGKPVSSSHRSARFRRREALSYSLKNLQRATVIGETTLAAHPIELKPIDTHFSPSAVLDFHQSRSPRQIGKQGESRPDVKVAADQRSMSH
jgi:hypothetical protein